MEIMVIKPAKKTIVIAEDHAALRECLKRMLNACPGFEVVGEANDGFEAIRLAEKLKPDLILMDLSMPRMNGMGALQVIKKQLPETKVLIITVHKTDEYVLAVLKAGANGYILKGCDDSELLKAISNIFEGNIYIGAGLPDRIAQSYLQSKGAKWPRTTWMNLTKQEKEVFRLITNGNSDSEIAATMHIRPQEAQTIRKNIMEKFDFHSLDDFASYAKQTGLVS